MKNGGFGVMGGGECWGLKWEWRERVEEWLGGRRVVELGDKSRDRKEKGTGFMFRN